MTREWMNGLKTRFGTTVAIVTLVLAMSTPAGAQQLAGSTDQPVSLSGPRFGVTYLSASIVDKLKDNDIDVGSFVTQFGWQFEKQFHTSETGPTLVTEWVLLAGGTEQGVFLPSASWLVGIRTRKGLEFAVGPNLTPVGAALVASAGITFRAGGLNVPVNLAVVPSKVSFVSYSGPPSFRATETARSGVRVSLLFGFNMRR